MNLLALSLFSFFLKLTQASERSTPSSLSSLSADSPNNELSFNLGPPEIDPLIYLERNDKEESFQSLSHSAFNELNIPNYKIDGNEIENNPSKDLESQSEFDSDLSPILNSKFTHYDDEHYRPRGSSFHNQDSNNPRKNLHLSIGWIHYSDDHWNPSDDMSDSPENRKNILKLMIADVKHGNLEQFRFLVGLLEKMGSVFEETKSELDFYNEESLIFAAVRSDNVDMFLEVMKYKKITFDDLNPCKLDTLSDEKKDRFSPGSYRSNKKSALDDDDDADDDDYDEEINVNIDETVFGQAIILNSIEIVNFLLDNGIRDDFPEGTQTALHLAVEKGHKIIARALLYRGGSQIDRANGGLLTPLMIAIQIGNAKIVEMLLKHGASLFIKDFYQRTCLHHAVINGNLEILNIIKPYILELPKTSRFVLFEAHDTYKKTAIQHAITIDIRLALLEIIEISGCTSLNYSS